MIKITLEDIMFWVFIAIIIVAALWLLRGSPPEVDTIISIGIAVAGSELLIWKKIFSIENKTTISFMKIRNDIDKLNININNNFEKINNRLILIENK